ncbi:MAG: galactose/methyl galactoside ABC transporter permease MglC [Peptoniphilaceae bacterium]|nr:galactose/methyl galactoside ABC transporter permease MglC [Peptoniphilaceae bacterium]MDD7383674.1 galactose/methyl galactoside ABC transporter permease MglC [Peptoniphilaceae bacterium]MDY3738771.1 galactose/methyl galactoside ABC transporter permease MglC [Peptoniphilaceae bacterium]
MSEVKQKTNIKELIINNLLIIILFVLILGIILIDPSFLNITNFLNILTQTSTRLFIALGTGGLLILAGTDLSAGRIVGMSAAVAGSLLQAATYAQKFFPNMGEIPIIVGLLAAIIIGGICGLINGFGVAYLNLHAFIASLGTQLIVYGLLQMYIASSPWGAQPIGVFKDSYTSLVMGGIPIPGTSYKLPYLLIYAAIATVVMWFIWNKTVLGKNMFAVGGNMEAAEVSGISIKRTIMLVFLLSGIMYGISGFLEGPRIGSVTSTTGTNYDLDAIEACLIGGVSFSGGIGTIPGIVLGSIILQVINYGLIYIGLSSNIQLIIKGALIIIAVAIDTRKRIKKK